MLLLVRALISALLLLTAIIIVAALLAATIGLLVLFGLLLAPVHVVAILLALFALILAVFVPIFVSHVQLLFLSPKFGYREKTRNIFGGCTKEGRWSVDATNTFSGTVAPTDGGARSRSPLRH